MKFACPKCSTRYSIADDKVPPAKTLRFPCKKCGNVIRLQRKKTATKKPSAQKAPAPVPDKAPAEGPAELEAVATRVAPLDELNKLRNEAAGSNNLDKTPAEPVAGVATKVASVKDLQEALAASAEETVADAPPASEPEWYVLIGGKQEGPMTAAEVQDKLERHEIDKRTYVWRDGWDDWQRIGATSEFKELAGRAGDAAWRVMAPVSDEVPESTVAMNANELHEQLQRVREESDANTPVAEADDVFSDESPGFEQEDTRQMDMSTAQEAMLEPDRSTDLSAPLDLHDPAIIDALSGEPTGDRMTRSTGDQPELLDDNAFPEAPNAPESFSEAELLTPADGVGGGEELPGFEDPFADSDATEEPVSDVGAAESSGVPMSPEYLQAPPGESTRVFMATAGLYKRRRTHRIAAAVGISVTLLLMTIVALDIMKIVELPGMGLLYASTGITDPNLNRGIQRVNEALAKPDLAPETRAELEENRRKYEMLLLDAGRPGEGTRTGGKRSGGGRRKGVAREGVKDTRDLGAGERDTLRDVFADDRKSERGIQLADPDRIETPNLPDGLSRDVIYKVFQENSRSIQLCYSESSRKGETLSGKMEIQVTIVPNGNVSEVDITTPEFKRSVMASCTIRRVNTWRFPRFNGEPVTVVLPYVVAPVL